MPPHHWESGFLPEEEHDRIFAWALSHRGRFTPARLAGGVVDPARRVSETVRGLGEVEEDIRRHLLAALPRFFTTTGVRAFEPDYVEVELAAHGDGAHFTRHQDIPVGPGRAPVGGDGSGRQDRLLSAVYYLHREPKGFSGGELRLHRFGSNDGPGDYVDIEPARNSLAVFPSWVTHEVREVACPSGRFEDRRFAVNVWFCKPL